jgi:chemotaxis protein CheD
VLGSCIGTCLRDPATRIGGMNHFMLPTPVNGGEEPSRFGVHAMELLIGEIQKLGGERGRLEAKIFGGGSVLRVLASATSVARLNIGFITDFLEREGIPIVGSDVGGVEARQVLFRTDTGSALVRRLRGGARVQALTVQERRQAADAPAGPGEITLFDEGPRGPEGNGPWSERSAC